SRRDSYLRVVLWSFSFVSFAHRALLSFPTRRSSDLEIVPFNKIPDIEPSVKGIILSGSPFSVEDKNAPDIDVEALIAQRPVLGVDRKSTRLNSSHVKISYAVFCLKKKTKGRHETRAG